ncbi:hypothetical protein A3A76_01355 [Candidatus Woesebacteria bacterium RIFCSPLOWO2_01_FULL_39_23]|uniref:Serine protease n=1 Tax=Candidatus Woesebacteria bacterium RIFCSPHIGHO2_01_FULL_40_22 TaxID=1802499 RepID=A0A1F7YGJ8_9BACT|nr:MAG: hypothetical protein A2141_05015 [Candidatus Woesebacteria bacterium RBG_16_40_11]OGM26471.1 MAG: hypothetical protein A2628_02950 [Candidatus Woesebacteria bacterium RIFCSPHIGHO2_01_FULL_40_22]OGM37640.1 MAG: hypothetical protein A3E41_05465 [Candidatus Woesebacteria bacterium RIFCSPHIGHO2_12_FULL_38_9]OGM62924.1 MAG: hypothetical protein A3A76_01355 [Candidatus Woesebacteria bacterium RIFCSPLOWO2_01_FULL_39_23]
MEEYAELGTPKKVSTHEPFRKRDQILIAVGCLLPALIGACSNPVSYETPLDKDVRATETARENNPEINPELDKLPRSCVYNTVKIEGMGESRPSQGTGFVIDQRETSDGEYIAVLITAGHLIAQTGYEIKWAKISQPQINNSNLNRSNFEPDEFTYFTSPVDMGVLILKSKHPIFKQVEPFTISKDIPNNEALVSVSFPWVADESGFISELTLNVIDTEKEEGEPSEIWTEGTDSGGASGGVWCDRTTGKVVGVTSIGSWEHAENEICFIPVYHWAKRIIEGVGAIGRSVNDYFGTDIHIDDFSK